MGLSNIGIPGLILIIILAFDHFWSPKLPRNWFCLRENTDFI